MSNVVISVENLGKRYLIGHQRSKQDGLRHALEELVRAPAEWLRGRRAAARRTEEFWALQDVSFEVEQGDVVGIVGRNGAGKSTLLKLLSRITAPTRGRIQLDGRVASLLEVGTGFHPELTGRENIFLNGAILGMARAEIRAKFDEIVAFSEVEKFLDTPVKRYSSGMYVRLAFAVAAHLEPEILIVDEVLAVGDAQFQKKCLGKMSEVAKGGRTVLFVSHNLAAVHQLTTKCVYLKNGLVQMQGRTADVLEVYNTGAARSNDGVYTLAPGTCTRLPGDGRVMFRHLRLLNAPLGILRDSATLSFRAEITAAAAAEDFRMGITVFKSDGTPVGNTFSAPKERIAAGETQVLVVSLPLGLLAPGKYHCGISLGRGGGGESIVDFDIVLDVLHFEVAPPRTAAITSQWNGAYWGAVVLPMPTVSAHPAVRNESDATVADCTFV